ncbi:LysR family transcriptional regulator [Paenibacillus sp. PL2-23]|uniref:LysR family transcriptional regulator n=1 Tax=Paenibacillus sp. PL2-23 TaxID=2100729 RepID=UPI0030F4F827
MDFKTLKTFHAIVKYGSFHRAAQEMNYVQSTVTMQMQKLESELGVILIERGKEMALTEAGRVFYEESLRIAKSMEHLELSMTSIGSGEAGHLRLGTTEPTASHRLPQILKAFIDEYPHIRVSVEIASTLTLSERIRKGELDLALATAPGIESDLYFEPLFQEKFVLLLPEHHPLTDKVALTPDDFAGHRLLITSSTCPYRKKLEYVLQEKGNSMLETMEVGSMTALKYYVQQGLGIALVPEIVVEPATMGTTIRAMEGSLIHMTTGLLCKESARPFQQACLKLYACLKKSLAETPVALKYD